MADHDNCVREIRREGDAIVVTLAGEIDLHKAPEVHRALVGACEEKPKHLVVNLEQVTYMDSSGIGTLVEVFRRVNAYEGKLGLYGVGPRVRSLFEITKLDKFFKIYPSEAEALRA